MSYYLNTQVLLGSVANMRLLHINYVTNCYGCKFDRTFSVNVKKAQTPHRAKK